MVDITKLLPRLLRANPELAAKLAWSQAAGEGLRRNAIPVNLIGKTLTVSVADALWQKQLQSMAAELLFRINSLLGGKGVDEIVFRIAPSDVLRANTRVPAQRAKEESPQPLPTELLFAAGAIADEDLRLRFLRAADNLIARRDSQPTE
jgi:Dna[CI] antecedent DciA-like protein